MLDGRSSSGPGELLDLIHAVNPTGRCLSAEDERRRYRLKARLQSLLVRRFPEEVVVAAEARDVVTIRHLRHGKDACHARLDELDVDARARVRLLLDLGHDADLDALAAREPSNESSFEPSRPGDSPGRDPLALGRAALAEYDYDAARSHFEDAMESTGGSPPAARALLELFVEHLGLDGAALAIEPHLSQAAAADAEVRPLLALAAARSDHTGAAHRFLKGLSGSRAADAWQALAQSAAARGAADEVDSALDRLADCDPTRPDLHWLRDEARRLRSEERRPAEEELRRLRDTGDDVAVETAARALLDRWPESAVAAQVLARIQEKRRQAEADRLLASAEAAFADHDLGRARELCRRAGAAGGDAAALLERIAASEAVERQAREDADVAQASARLAAGDLRPGLDAYLALDADLRRRVRSEVSAPVLDWLDTAAADRPSARPRALIDAVLAVDPAIEALERGDEQAALAILDPHERLLAGVAPAREVSAEALRRLETRRRDGAAAALAEACLALDRGDLDGCQQLRDGLTRRHLDASGRARLDRLVDELRRRRDVAARRARVEELEGAGDLVAARRELDALLAADLVDGEQATALRAWRDRVAAQVRLAWRVRLDDTTLSIDDGDPIGELLGGLPYSDGIATWLVAGGSELVLASARGHHVFVGRVSVGDRRIVKRLALRVPERLGEMMSVLADGETLWLIDQSGWVLELDWQTGDPRRWVSLGDFLRPQERIDGAFVLPGGSYLWLVACVPPASESVRVIEIDRWRIQRELPRSRHFQPLVTGGTPCVLATDFEGGTLLHTDRGGIAEEITACAGMRVSTVTRDPTGELVALGSRSDNEEEARVEIFQIVAGRAVPRQVLPDSDVDLALRCGASRRHGLLFVHHYIERRRANLAAFRVVPAGLEPLYNVPAPSDVLLAGDPAANELVCLWDSRDGVEISVLGPAPPRFEASREGQAAWELPVLADMFPCHPSSGGSGGDGDGDAASAELLDAANLAACRADWPQVRALLDGIPLGSVASRLVAHHCHLLGLSQLRTGVSPDRAREVWEAGTAHDLRDPFFGCRLDACLDLVEPLPDPLPVEWWDSRASLVRQLRGAIVASDALLAEGDVRGALRVLRSRAVIRTGEVQAGARLASAWLTAGAETPAERFDMAIALARFVALAEKRTVELPIEGAWDGDRFAAVVARAAAWLADW